jgi:hypothetical protein
MSNNENETRIELNSFEKVIYKINTMGEIIFLGFDIIESQSQTVEELTRECVDRALGHMQNRHPLLRAHLEFATESDKVEFVYSESKTERLCLTEWKKVESREKMMDIVHVFANSTFDLANKGLLWRFKTIEFVEDEVKKFTLAILINGVITDGLNGMTLLVEIVNIVNAMLKNEECTEMKVRHERAAKNFHDLAIERNLFNEAEQSSKFEEVRMQKLAHEPFLIPEALRVPGEAGAHLETFFVDETRTTELLNFLKTKSQRPTGVLTSIFFQAVRQLYADNGLKFPGQISFVCPASMRVRYEPKLDLSEVGFHVLICHVHYDLPRHTVTFLSVCSSFL